MTQRKSAHGSLKRALTRRIWTAATHRLLAVAPHLELLGGGQRLHSIDVRRAQEIYLQAWACTLCTTLEK